MVITRTYTATVSKKCCRNGDVVYSPPDREFKIRDIKDRTGDFEYSLTVWRDEVEKTLEKLADNECRRKGTPRLCFFDVYNVNVEETGKSEIPISILNRIDTIREYIREAETYDEKKALQDEAVGLLRDYMTESEARDFVKT